MEAFSPAQAIVAAMITPALLILASASLIATVLVRLARVVDRIRKLAEAQSRNPLGEEIERQERRALLAERALGFFFSAVTTIVLAGFSIALDRARAGPLSWIPVPLTTLGMALIVAGCAAMLAETRLSIAQLRAEIALLRD